MGDRVHGKAIIVTGAGSVGPGIGNGKAANILYALYAREGGRVFLVDQDLAAAEETRRAIVDEGGRPVAFAGDVEDMRIRRAQLCPTGTQGDVWDTAYAALFLASEEAKYITGTTLMADGGITCRIR